MRDHRIILGQYTFYIFFRAKMPNPYSLLKHISALVHDSVVGPYIVNIAPCHYLHSIWLPFGDKTFSIHYLMTIYRQHSLRNPIQFV